MIQDSTKIAKNRKKLQKPYKTNGFFTFLVDGNAHGDLPNGPAKGFLEASSSKKKDSSPILSTPMTHQGGLAD